MVRRTLWMVGLALGLALAVVPAQSALAAEGGCAGAVRDLEAQLNTLLAPVKANPALARGKGASDLQTKLANVFAVAQKTHPECKAQITQAGQALRSASGQRAAGQHAKGFLGPIGWLWNNIYYRVFQGNNVMMAIFGWELFLSPVILAIAAYNVLYGVGGALRKPTVPDAIRSAA